MQFDPRAYINKASRRGQLHSVGEEVEDKCVVPAEATERVTREAQHREYTSVIPALRRHALRTVDTAQRRHAYRFSGRKNNRSVYVGATAGTGTRALDVSLLDRDDVFRGIASALPPEVLTLNLSTKSVASSDTMTGIFRAPLSRNIAP